MREPACLESGSVAVALLVHDSNRRRLAACLRAWSAAGVEVVVVDRTLEGLDLSGIPVVREPLPSRGLAWKRALDVTDAEWIAWHEPEVSVDATRFERQLALATDEIDLVTGTVRTRGEATSAEFEPLSHWQSGVLVRRSALAMLDETCFTPAELELHEYLTTVGRTSHAADVELEVDADAWHERAADAALDRELLRLAKLPRAERPVVSVLMACHERWPVLVKCLAGFSRQLLPPGSIEIIVCDDGSTDETPRLAPRLELPVDFHYSHRPNAGACAARNRGLGELRGELTLFVNDDTIPFADTVARHLEVHERLAGERVAVLGTFEQPPKETRNAFTRMLEDTTVVFAYAGFEPGQVLGGQHFYTCNVSLPTAAVREVGAFDESFPCFGEDTDYGLRLEKAGYDLVYWPAARSVHHHVLELEDFRRRQHKVALAHVRLYAKHPHIVPEAVAKKTVPDLCKSVQRAAGAVPILERAAANLARLDLASIEAVGGPFESAARGIEDNLEELVRKLNNVWWYAGLAAGFEATGGSGFPELLANAQREETARV